MNGLRRVGEHLMTAATLIGAVGLTGLMLVIAGTVVLRWFGVTFQGSYEVAEAFTIVTITFCIIMATVRKGHVNVVLIFDHFPPTVKRVLNTVLTLMAAVLWCFVTWACYKLTMQLALRGEVTHVLQIDIVPFRWITTLGFGTVATILFYQSWQYLRGHVDPSGGAHDQDEKANLE